MSFMIAEFTMAIDRCTVSSLCVHMSTWYVKVYCLSQVTSMFWLLMRGGMKPLDSN